MNGYLTAKFGHRKVIIGGMVALSAFIFIVFFVRLIKLQLPSLRLKTDITSNYRRPTLACCLQANSSAPFPGVRFVKLKLVSLRLSTDTVSDHRSLRDYWSRLRCRSVPCSSSALPHRVHQFVLVYWPVHLCGSPKRSREQHHSMGLPHTLRRSGS